MSKYEFLFFKVGRSDVGTNGQTDRQMKNRSEHDSKILEAQRERKGIKSNWRHLCVCVGRVCVGWVCVGCGGCVCVLLL